MPARIVLVHGSVIAGRPTWTAQLPLEERFELLILDRPGFPPNPPVERVDFAHDADLLSEELREGDHLVGHSYGGVITLLAASRRPAAVRSLTVIEPPATRVALGQPAVDRFARDAIDVWSNSPTDDPGVSAPVPGSRGLVVRSSLPAPAGARAGCARAHRGARPLGGGDPTRDPGRIPVPEARRLRCPPCGVRRDLRRARARPSGGAPRASRLRPHRAAPSRFNASLTDFVERATVGTAA